MVFAGLSLSIISQLSAAVLLHRLTPIFPFKMRVFTGILAVSAACYLTRQVACNALASVNPHGSMAGSSVRRDARTCSLPSEQKQFAASVLRCCSADSFIDWCGVTQIDYTGPWSFVQSSDSPACVSHGVLSNSTYLRHWSVHSSAHSVRLHDA